jgi:hypothetical protein
MVGAFVGLAVGTTEAGFPAGPWNFIQVPARGSGHAQYEKSQIVLKLRGARMVNEAFANHTLIVTCKKMHEGRSLFHQPSFS